MQLADTLKERDAQLELNKKKKEILKGIETRHVGKELVELKEKNEQEKLKEQKDQEKRTRTHSKLRNNGMRLRLRSKDCSKNPKSRASWSRSRWLKS